MSNAINNLSVINYENVCYFFENKKPTHKMSGKKISYEKNLWYINHTSKIILLSLLKIKKLLKGNKVSMKYS